MFNLPKFYYKDKVEVKNSNNIYYKMKGRIVGKLSNGEYQVDLTYMFKHFKSTELKLIERYNPEVDE